MKLLGEVKAPKIVIRLTENDHTLQYPFLREASIFHACRTTGKFPLKSQFMVTRYSQLPSALYLYSFYDYSSFSMCHICMPNKCSLNIFTKFHMHTFANTRCPSLLFRPIRLQICWFLGSCQKFWEKDLMCRTGLWRRLKYPDLQFSRNCTNHMRDTLVRFPVTLFFCLAFSQWTVDRQEDKHSGT